MKNEAQQVTGAEVLSILEYEGSSELKRVRQFVEEAIELDIKAYLSDLGSKELSPNVLVGLTAAAIAGGQWGFSNLTTRLEATNLQKKDLELSANEILSLVHRHTSILNNIRLKISAVQSIVKTFVFKDSSLSSRDEIERLLKLRIPNQSVLNQWGEDTEKLFQKQVTSTGQVSSRSISTYSKLWKSYLDEKIAPRIGNKVVLNKSEFISERIKPLINYKAPTTNQIKKILADSPKKYDFVINLKTANKLNKLEKLITYKKNLGGRALKISYNSSGIDPDLIQPVLNSIKGQIMLDPKQSKLSVDMSNEFSQVIVEIERPIKDDVDTLKIQLGALASNL
jgi:hypothetical protein